MTAGTRPAPIELPDLPPSRRKSLFARAPHAPVRLEQVADRAVLDLIGPLGDDGISVSDFERELKKASGPLTVRLHSPGGEVFTGIWMHNALARYPGHVRVEVAALAASAASIVALSGDELAIARHARLMIHNSWSMCVGPAQDMRKEAEVLEGVDDSLVGIYHARTGIGMKELHAMLDNETWLSGDEAVRLGFASTLLDGKAAPQAAFDLSVYRNTPEALLGVPENKATQIASVADLERRLRDGLGLSRGAARKVASAGFYALTTMTEEAAQIETLTAKIVAATERLKNKNKKDRLNVTRRIDSSI